MDNKKGRYILVIAAAVFIATNALYTGAFAASGSLDSAQTKKEQIQSSLSDAQDLIENLKKSKGDASVAVEALDKKVTEISTKMSELQDKISDTDKEISKTEALRKKAVKKEKSQYDSMRERIQFMYENSGTGYLETVLGSGSFAQLINRAVYFEQIMQYDRKMLEEYQETRNLVEKAEDTLKSDRESLKKMKENIADEKKAVNLLLDKKEAELTSLNSDLGDAESKAKEYKAELEAANQIISEIKAAEQKASQNASGNSGVNTSKTYTGGQFTWPCPSSHTISSGFGKRTAPTKGASTYHNGIDIAASYGSAIVAAAAGDVTAAGYSSSMGNYVILSHGGGLYTVYFHASSLQVSAGEKVKRGQTIARVGSTGISTGCHLHFGVQLNGQYVNPMNYLK